MATIRPLNTDLASDDMSTWIYHMMNDKMYLPDSLRDYNLVIDTLNSTASVSTKPMGIYHGGKLMGVFTMTDIVPTHQARLLFWGWGKWCALGAVKVLREYIDIESKKWELKRIYAQTPFRNLIKLLGLVGFSEEGRFKRGYQYGGKLYKLYQTRMLMGG